MKIDSTSDIVVMKIPGSPRVDGDEDEEDVDDLDNEFNHTQGHGRTSAPWQLQEHGTDNELSSSSRHDSHGLIPRLTSGQMVCMWRNYNWFRKFNAIFLIFIIIFVWMLKYAYLDDIATC